MSKIAALIRARVWRQVWQNFALDYIPLRASALSFQTMASLVPVGAIVLAILSNPAFKDSHDEMLNALFQQLSPVSSSHDTFLMDLEDDPALQDPGDKTQDKAFVNLQTQWKTSFRDFIKQVTTNVGAISVFAFATLLVIAMVVFRTVEATFNAIWKVRSGRGLVHRAVLTTSLIFWTPVIIGISLGVAKRAAAHLDVIGVFVLPVFFTALGFAAIYMIIPNARVRFFPAFLAGLCAAILWELCKTVFVLYLQYVVSRSTVYGSLGLVPMVFGWVYISWLVLLTGAELCYVLQTVERVHERFANTARAAMNLQNPTADNRSEKVPMTPLTLALAIEIGRRFKGGDAPGGARASELAPALGIDALTLDGALKRLLDAGVIVQVAETGQGGVASTDSRFLPARDLSFWSLADLVRLCRGPIDTTARGPSYNKATEILGRLEQDAAAHFGALTLNELCAQTVTPVPAPAAAAPQKA